MIVHFTVISQLVLDVNEYAPPGNTPSEHMGLKWNLEISDNLDAKSYFDKNEFPNADGVSAITKVLCNALIANIHYAHDSKIKDGAEHFRDAIKEMEKLFIESSSVKRDIFS